MPGLHQPAHAHQYRPKPTGTTGSNRERLSSILLHGLAESGSMSVGWWQVANRG